MVSIRPWLLGTFTALVGACREAPLPDLAEEFEPPAVYRRWWTMTQQCSGHTGDFNTIQWYRVPGMTFTNKGERVSGVWNPRRSRILLAERSLEHGPLVRHEMLHAMLPDSTEHPPEQFLGRCAPIVTCGPCGPWHPPTAYELMPAESLVVTSKARLLERETDGQRWVSLETVVTNAASHAIVAVARGKYPPAFQFELTHDLSRRSGGEVTTDSSTVYFAPGAVKRWVHEMRVIVSGALDRNSIAPGRYLVRGGYGNNWGAYDTLEVVP